MPGWIDDPERVVGPLMWFWSAYFRADAASRRERARAEEKAALWAKVAEKAEGLVFEVGPTDGAAFVALYAKIRAKRGDPDPVDPETKHAALLVLRVIRDRIMFARAGDREQRIACESKRSAMRDVLGWSGKYAGKWRALVERGAIEWVGADGRAGTLVVRPDRLVGDEVARFNRRERGRETKRRPKSGLND